MAFESNLHYKFVKKKKEKLILELYKTGRHKEVYDKHSEILEILKTDKFIYINNKKVNINTQTMKLVILNVCDLVVYGEDIKFLKGITSNLYIHQGKVCADRLICINDIFKGNMFQLKDIIVEEISFKKFSPHIYLDEVISKNRP